MRIKSSCLKRTTSHRTRNTRWYVPRRFASSTLTCVGPHVQCEPYHSSAYKYVCRMDHHRLYCSDHSGVSGCVWCPRKLTALPAATTSSLLRTTMLTVYSTTRAGPAVHKGYSTITMTTLFISRTLPAQRSALGEHTSSAVQGTKELYAADTLQVQWILGAATGGREHRPWVIYGPVCADSRYSSHAHRLHADSTIAQGKSSIAGPPSSLRIPRVSSGGRCNTSSSHAYPVFFSSGLPEGPHTVTLTNVGETGKDGVDFDWVVVTSNPSDTTSASPASSASSTSLSSSSTSSSTPSVSSSSTAETVATAGSPHLDQSTGNDGSHQAQSADKDKGSNVAPIIGGVAGGLIFLAIALALSLWFYRRRKTRAEPSEKTKNRVDLNDDGDFHGRSVNPFVYSVAGTRGSERDPDEVAPAAGYLSIRFRSGSASSFGHSAQDDITPNPVRVDDRYLSSPIPPPPSSNSSYSQTEDGRRYDDHSEPLPSPPSRLPYTEAYSGLNHSTYSDTHRKSPAPSLPYTAVPATTTRGSWHERMTVDGREVDVGPASPRSDEGIGGRLPPNYQQATQPLPGQSPIR